MMRAPWLAAGIAAAIVAASHAAAADPPRDTVRLGLMRGVPEKWALDENFEVFLERLAEADAQGVELFITPECWLDGYASPDPASTRDRVRSIAQDLDTSAYLVRVANEARARDMFICFGFTSLEGDEVYNTAGLWNSDGELVGLYHKTHLQAHDLQYNYGAALPIWPTPWGPIGIMICADRRWPETARALRLQGARLILNPTYGFHGDLNTAMMRTRAYENECFIAFAHPEEGLITGPRGATEAQELGDSGVLVYDVDLSTAATGNHLGDRRPELYGVIAQGGSAATSLATPEGPVLRVAAAQMLSTFDVASNAARIVAMLEEAHAREVHVVAFPEMALTGYSKDASLAGMLDWDAIDAGLTRIAETCDRLDLYAVIGAPTRDENAVYCSAITIGPDGATRDVYEKIYLAGEAWATPGRRLSIFSIEGTPSASFVCHDERYAPLVQLRALAGAQLFFYISCESGIRDMHKRLPYRAQVQARAVENRVFIVHANTPAAPNASGLADVSHGESRIVDPDGNVIAEAPVFGETLLVADVHLGRASTRGLPAALSAGPLVEWMHEGLSLVQQATQETPSSGP